MMVGENTRNRHVIRVEDEVVVKISEFFFMCML